MEPFSCKGPWGCPGWFPKCIVHKEMTNSLTPQACVAGFVHNLVQFSKSAKIREARNLQCCPANPVWSQYLMMLHLLDKRKQKSEPGDQQVSVNCKGIETGDIIWCVTLCTSMRCKLGVCVLQGKLHQHWWNWRLKSMSCSNIHVLFGFPSVHSHQERKMTQWLLSQTTKEDQKTCV